MLAERLAVLLKTSALTKAGLGKRLGVTRQTVYYWFNGQTKAIDTETALKLASEFRVRLAWVQNGEEPMYASPELSEDEHQIIAFYKRMSDTDKGVFMKMARTLATDSESKPTRGDPFGLPPPR